MPRKRHLLRVLLMEEEEGWSAQCIDYDIAACADSLNDLVYEFERAVVGHIAICEEAKVEPFADLPPAPEHFRRLFKVSTTSVDSEPFPFREVPGYLLQTPETDYRIA